MPPLTVHHLGLSQSERVVWLCEELGLDYTLVRHTRDPKTAHAPPALASFPGNDMGTAPVLQDGDTVVTESGAIMEYLITQYGQGRLTVRPGEPNYVDYLRFWHFGNGTLQPSHSFTVITKLAKLSPEDPLLQMLQSRWIKSLQAIEKRLGETNAYLAGPDFTAADIFNFFSLTTGRYFLPMSFADYPNLVMYLQRIGRREAYRRAMEKAEPGLELLLEKEAQVKAVM